MKKARFAGGHVGLEKADDNTDVTVIDPGMRLAESLNLD